MIRLQRKGKKHQPFYRLVVGEKRSKLLGEQVEELGWFDPGQNTNSVNKERVQYWMSKGAKLSPTVHNLFVTAGVVTGKKIAVHKTKKGGAGTPTASVGEAPKAPSTSPGQAEPKA